MRMQFIAGHNPIYDYTIHICEALFISNGQWINHQFKLRLWNRLQIAIDWKFEGCARRVWFVRRSFETCPRWHQQHSFEVSGNYMHIGDLFFQLRSAVGARKTSWQRPKGNNWRIEIESTSSASTVRAISSDDRGVFADDSPDSRPSIGKDWLSQCSWIFHNARSAAESIFEPVAEHLIEVRECETRFVGVLSQRI